MHPNVFGGGALFALLLGVSVWAANYFIMLAGGIIGMVCLLIWSSRLARIPYLTKMIRFLSYGSMAAYLFHPHCCRRTLRNGNIRNPGSHGSYHGRNVDDNHHRQKLESTTGRNFCINLRILLFLFYKHRKRQPIYP